MARVSDRRVEVVRAGHDQLGEGYRDWSTGGMARARFLRSLLDRLKPGSAVVDLGCGPRVPVTRELVAGGPPGDRD